MNSISNPTVFIIDDDLEMRNSLEWLMQAVQLEVETFGSATSFLKTFNVNRTGCILLDVRMPEMSGLELLDALIALKNRLPVIVMTGHGDIPMAIRAMKSGALDFILKPLNDQQLIEQIQKALVQNSASSMILYDQVKENFSTLSTREKEIMILVTEGKLNKQIAYDLNIGLSTVELYRARVMKKMQAKNIIQLVEMKMALKS